MSERFHVLCLQWRLWIRPLIFCIYGTLLFILLPYVFYILIHSGVQSSTVAWLIGAIFVILTIPLSFWQIIQHLANYTKPKLQKHIIRILWMVPIYSLDAWIVLWQPYLAIYLDTARECYEAYVIYNFMMFLLHFLDEEIDLQATLEVKQDTNHIFPLCCLKTWPSREFIHRCKHGILQYTVFHLITTSLAFVFGMVGIYGQGNFSPKYAFVYLFVVNNISQFVAMYCLVLFYKAMSEELKPMRPLAKFLCIKAVVFFSFFQGVGILFLVKMGVITEVFGISEDDDLYRISNLLQNFLICAEMFVAAVCHHYAFSYKTFVDPEFEGTNCYQSFMNIWDVSDVSSDIREHVYVVRDGMKRHLIPGGSDVGSVSESGETDRLIGSSNHPKYSSTSESDRDFFVDETPSMGSSLDARVV